MKAFAHFALARARIELDSREGGGMRIVVTGPVPAERIVIEVANAELELAAEQPEGSDR